MDHNKYDTIIIGGGPGGYSAALYCARANLKTLIIEKLYPGGQMATTSMIDNYPGFDMGIDGVELAGKMKSGADRFGAETIFAEVTEVDMKGPDKIIKLADGNVLYTKTIVIATGAAPRNLGLPYEKQLTGSGISYCATCDGMFYKDKTVVIVGGGNSAAADALILSKICKKVYLVHRHDTLKASPTYMAPLENASNLTFVWDSKIKEVLYDNKVTGVRLENLKDRSVSEIDCDGVFVAIGRMPNTKIFYGKIEMNPEGYIVADETTRTSEPGVFAVGDLREKPLRQVVTATSDGAVASKFIEDYITHGFWKD